MRETLSQKIENLSNNKGNLYVISGTVWNTKQLMKIIDKNDRQNEIVKIEITKGLEARSLNYIIFKYPQIVRE